MGTELGIWFVEDIRNVLLAANEAGAATAAVIAEVGGGPSASPSAGSGQTVADSTELVAVSLQAYREGYKAALTAVALAFGIAPQTIALRPFDCAQDRPLNELGTMQVQDKALGRAYDEIPQPLQFPK